MNKSERNLGNLHVKTNITTYGFMAYKYIWIYLPKSWQRPANSTHNTSLGGIFSFGCTCRRWWIIFPAKWHTLQINQYFYFIARYFHFAYDLIKLMRLKEHRRYKFLGWYRFFSSFYSTAVMKYFRILYAKYSGSGSFYTLRTISGAVVLNHCSESRMRLPSTLCATLSRFSIKPLVFCATDVVLKYYKTCQLIFVKNFVADF